MLDASARDDAEVRVFLRPPVAADADEYIALVQANRDFLHPWVDPPDDRETFLTYVESGQSPDFKPFLICSGQDKQILGSINLSQISLGNFCSAYVGFWISKQFSGRGLMSAALLELFRIAFGEMGLHRLEMNVQPTNERSVRLMKRLHIRREGYSPRYLRVNGVWADHERWAVCAEDVFAESEGRNTEL